MPGPSLTEGYPATNPALRVLEFDASTYELLDMHTYTADLHAANTAPRGDPLRWGLEYSFRDQFNMSDLSAASFEALAARLAADGSAAWHEYKGRGSGALACQRYRDSTAPFAAISPGCPACPDGSACKRDWIELLNGTNLG